MIIEDDKLGTDKVTYKRISYKIRSSFKFSYSKIGLKLEIEY